MSYQVLARKWRPRFFKEMVGQEHVLKALINALDNNRLHQAYLFTGTRGVGKTTIARILAKCLNCETGVTSEPCGTCSACTEINQGSFVDLIEIDAASHTGVDSMRQITDNVQYKPSKGRYKVYLIDEVHMLSTSSFNAFLKTLEEPPEYSKFLLATTDPQKLPATVLSRCLQFNLKNMVPEHIVNHLSHILQQETITFEENALWALARAASGSMRDALSLTDQAISFGQGKVLAEDVAAMLGTIDQQTVLLLAKALIEYNAADVLQIISNASELSPDYAAILDALLVLLHRLTLAQMVPQAVDNSEGDKENVLQLAQHITASELQLFYQMGLLGKRDLYLAPDARTGLEMALLRMLAFRPDHLTEPKPEISLQAQSTISATTQEVEAKKIEAAPAINQAIPAQAAPVVQDAAPSINTETVEDTQTALNSVQEAVVKEPEPAAATDILLRDNQDWLTLYPKLSFAGGILNQVISECVFLEQNDNKIEFLISPEKADFYNDSQQQQMAQILSEHFGQVIAVRVQVAEHDQQTPNEAAQQQKRQQREQALQQFSNDEVVQYLQQHYQATVIPESLKVQGKVI